MPLAPNIRELFEEELEKLTPKSSTANRLLAKVSLNRGDYFDEDKSANKYSTPQLACYLSFIKDEPENTALKKGLTEINEADDPETKEALIQNWLNSFVCKYIPFPKEGSPTCLRENEFYNLFGRYLSHTTGNTSNKFITDEFRPEGSQETEPFVDMSEDNSTLIYYMNNRQEISHEQRRQRCLFWEPIVKDAHELTRAEKYWNSLFEFLYDENLRKTQARMIFESFFPNNQLDAVLEELKNRSSELHHLSQEQMFVLITNPKLAPNGMRKKYEEQKGSDPTAMTPNWNAFEKVAQSLATHVLRKAFHDRVVEVTPFHPTSVSQKEPQEERSSFRRMRRVDVKETAEKLRASGEKLTEYKGRNPIVRLFTSKPILELKEEEREIFDTNIESPEMIASLHKTLLAITECINRAQSIQKIAGHSTDWKQFAIQHQALAKALLRALPDHLRQMEFRLAHPEVLVQIDAVSELTTNLMLSDFNEIPSLEEKIADLHARQSAAEEVRALSARKK